MGQIIQKIKMKSTLFLSILILISHFSLLAEPFLLDFNAPWQDTDPYHSPTERFLKMYPYSQIHTTLQTQEIFLNQSSFYDTVIKQEERGFIGYHASGHQFRVFQDIIRITLEEVLGLEFKRDFYFFRFPGDHFTNDHASANEFLLKYPTVNDNIPEQRNQLVSTNFTLFNNFDQKYECSPVFFELARSFLPPNFEAKIILFFNEMGMETIRIEELFTIGESIENDQAGTLFQFFDLSYQDPFNHTAYEFMDKFAYACKKKGEPLKNVRSLSELYHGIQGSRFLDQYRIVMNHEAFLNPYSSISMRRYDLNNPNQVKDYENKLRSVIKSIPYDSAKADLYKLKLMQYWGLNG